MCHGTKCSVLWDGTALSWRMEGVCPHQDIIDLVQVSLVFIVTCSQLPWVKMGEFVVNLSTSASCAEDGRITSVMIYGSGIEVNALPAVADSSTLCLRCCQAANEAESCHSSLRLSCVFTQRCHAVCHMPGPELTATDHRPPGAGGRVAVPPAG